MLTKNLYKKLLLSFTLFVGLSSGIGGTGSAKAQDVTLKLINGGLVIKGKLIKYNGSFYVVESSNFGTITVDANKFVCTSNTCPSQPTIAQDTVFRRKAPVTNDFSIHGSNTIGAALMPALIEGYARSIRAKTSRIVGEKPEEVKLVLNNQEGKKVFSVDLHSHGSGTSAPGLASGKAQLGMSSRPIKSKEIQKLVEVGINDIKARGNENILALDGLIVIVSPTNSIQTLSIEQIAKIFSGQITDWSELGRSKPGRINIYSRDRKSGTYDTFKSLVLKPYRYKMSPKVRRFESNADLSDSTANDPNGIGFSGFAYKRNAKVLSISSACGITRQASLFNVKTEEYPLARRLYVYTSPQVLSSPYAKNTLKFALSDKAQPIISRVGFISQTIHSLPFTKQGDRIAAALNITGEDFNLDLVRDFTRTLAGASRLSVTFRFKSGSTELSNKSQSDIQRFANLIRTGSLKNKDIYVVGYSDDQGDFNKNKELAFKRALAIKFAVLTAADNALPSERMKLKSFGELFPVSCNTNKIGRAKNRRVEVWIK